MGRANQPREGQRINLEGANFNQKSKLTWWKHRLFILTWEENMFSGNNHFQNHGLNKQDYLSKLKIITYSETVFSGFSEHQVSKTSLQSHVQARNWGLHWSPPMKGTGSFCKCGEMCVTRNSVEARQNGKNTVRNNHDVKQRAKNKSYSTHPFIF